MMNYKKRLVAASLMLATASLTSMLLTSYAAAQCAECSIYPNRDPFTGGLETSAGKPVGAVPPAVSNAAVPSHAANNAHAEMRGHHGRNAGSPDARAR
jgi:hypothetical protein